MTIITNIKSFVFNQSILVIDNEEIIYSTKATIKELPNVICSLANKYNCENVKITGASKKYMEEIKNKTNVLFNNKFSELNEFKLKIECI